MAVDGIYSITFRGAADWGMGLLMLQNKAITGADVGGITYDGTFEEKNDSVIVNMQLTVPPGVTLVQGTRPHPEVTTFPFKATIPKRAIDTHEPVLVQMPIGPVNVIFKRLRSL